MKMSGSNAIYVLESLVPNGDGYIILTRLVMMYVKVALRVHGHLARLAITLFTPYCCVTNHKVF